MHWGRVYFAVQAVAGVAWWIAVFAWVPVREATLGGLDPVVVAAFDVPLFVVGSAVAAAGVRASALVATGWTCLVAVALAGYATITGEAGWGVLLMAAAAAGSVAALCLVLWGRVPTEWILRGPFAFRPAAARQATARHVATTFGQIVVFWGLFLGVIPLALAALEQRWAVAIGFPPFALAVGVAVLALASILGIGSAVAMSTRGRGTPLPSAMPNLLVIAGPYRWLRNPMAVAGIAQGVAVGLLLGSWLVIVYALAGSLLWNYAIRPAEEADLERRFGDEFRRYRSEVGCWIPRVPKARRSALG
ncbi:methyltransferase family protein [Leifsonia poae]|uniref:methyltransferase family protein n=1 Tax=Leifsonia poae TaxID=110933 RepID=UPI001CC09F87|nr:isoprenylcysteine carboxylmethyltransferase family protein [Leifsonia poae]